MSEPRFENGPWSVGPEDAITVQEADPQHLSNLIFLSYRFSQGGIGTQNRMLLYIEENFHPTLMEDRQDADAKRTLVHRNVGKFFLNQRLHPATAIPWEDDSPEAAVKTDTLVRNELSGLFERFADRKQLDGFTSNLAGIAQSIIVMDDDYLKRPGGRGGDSKDLKIVVSPYTRDPYDSHFIRYGVLGTSTNTAEYDAIFSSLASEEILGQLDGYTHRQLQRIINIYIKTHPDTEHNAHITRVKALSTELLHAR